MLPKSVRNKNEENMKKPSFWKSLSPGEIWKSKSMRMIPEEFVRSLPGAFEHRIVFSVRWGNSWQLWLEREKDCLFMDEEDWNEFVDDNHLAPNDILGFTHDNTMFLDARIFKNGREVMDTPLEAEPLSPHQDTTTASSSASRKRKRRAKGTCVVENPERYLSNPKNPYFVRTLVRKNDVLYVSQALVEEHGLKFGPFNSHMIFILPGESMVGYNKIYNKQHCFGGWADVCKKKNWTEGDTLVCEFELSKGVVMALRVHFVSKGLRD